MCFEQKLVLNRWVLSLFGVSSFESLTRNLKGSELEDFDQDNISRFYRALCLHIPTYKRPHLPDDLLLAYDQNIVRHWKRITERRNHAGSSLYPKYFQYLALLFTEIYLDRYFHDADNLLAKLNKHVEDFNSKAPEPNRVEPYTRQDLNKIAFWMATGSGKTLLMHINILQYLYYLQKYRRERELNRIILLTPNEGLSYQHLEEFKLSGIQAELFSKEGRSLFTGRTVEILDIHKLRDEMGEKTVAVEAFEGNNLVLVDEGHRGTSRAAIGAWMQKRNQLCEKGFSFEYSATFGQAIKASDSRALEQTYAKCILFDYSYKYFYADGYGKDYRILNLADDSDEAIRRRYLTACLLTFYQQLKLYQDKSKEFRDFLIERPLWVFVGSSVNAVRSKNEKPVSDVNEKSVSDVVDILLFLAKFVGNRENSIEEIGKLLNGQTNLLDQKGRDIFSGAFSYLNTLPLTPDRVFDNILRVLFNAEGVAALHVENLKGTDGEVALRLGANKPFGVISVGDAAKLCERLCKDHHNELKVSEREFSDSLFRTISDESSTINILIGSKKFIEGWSSWRVSTMGLMNIGSNEGPQIIQLFGRGVRLKGKKFSLKRSQRLEEDLKEQAVPQYIEILETLNIFGIRADYMHEFQKYLKDEGLSENEAWIEFVLPVIKNLGSRKLKIVRLKKDTDFKKERPNLELESKPLEVLRRHQVVLDWYPKVKVIASDQAQISSPSAERNQGYLDELHLEFLDLDAIYFELFQFKNERGWYNLTIPRNNLVSLLKERDWYRLYIPEEALEFRSFRQIQLWQEIATALLKKYLDRYYKFKKQEFEAGKLEYQELSEGDPNFVTEYRLLVKQSRKDIIKKLHRINKKLRKFNKKLQKIKRSLISKRRLRDVQFQSLRVLTFSRHLYAPLIYVGNDLIEVKPVVLENESERDFVLHLQKFCESEEGKEFLRGKELYLLRNLSRGRGIGFFEAGNFYPDFILWLIVDDKQYVNFIDPKGLRNLEGPEDPKIRFHQTIKDLERQLGDSKVVLNSFIVSTTRSSEVDWWIPQREKDDLLEDKNILFQWLEDKHILFQREDRDNYIKKLLYKCLQSHPVDSA